MIKNTLVQVMEEMILKHIHENTIALESSIESMTQETKSSAGDKFETARAILQGEQDRLKSQIFKNKSNLATLKQINIQPHDTIKTGSLVTTSDGFHYFLSLGLGKINVEGTLYYAVSYDSPIGAALIGKQKGDKFSINNREKAIIEVL